MSGAYLETVRFFKEFLRENSGEVRHCFSFPGVSSLFCVAKKNEGGGKEGKECSSSRPTENLADI